MIKVSDLESMTTHELSDLLAEITLLLRRMPNVPVGELKAVEQPIQTNADALAAKVRHEQVNSGTNEVLPDWLKE